MRDFLPIDRNGRMLVGCKRLAKQENCIVNEVLVFCFVFVLLSSTASYTRKMKGTVAVLIVLSKFSLSLIFLFSFLLSPSFLLHSSFCYCALSRRRASHQSVKKNLTLSGSLCRARSLGE